MPDVDHVEIDRAREPDRLFEPRFGRALGSRARALRLARRRAQIRLDDDSAAGRRAVAARSDGRCR